MKIIDIEILENFLDKNERKFVNPKKYQFLVALEKLIQAYKQDEKVIKEAREFIENKMEYLKKCRTFKVVFYDEENIKHEWNEHLLYKENKLLNILKGN